MSKPKKGKKPNRVQLDESFSIVGDLNDWRLYYTGTFINEDGEQVTRTEIWYYSTLKMCLDAYLDKSPYECKEVGEILVKLDEVKKIIKKL